MSVQSEDLCRGLYVFSELRREVIVRFVDEYWWNWWPSLFKRSFHTLTYIYIHYFIFLAWYRHFNKKKWGVYYARYLILLKDDKHAYIYTYSRYKMKTFILRIKVSDNSVHYFVYNSITNDYDLRVSILNFIPYLLQISLQ